MSQPSVPSGNEDVMSRGSLAVAALSTVVEWYDFTLFLYMATVLSRVFYGSSNGSLSTTLASFAVAYLMRPLGAAVFGHVGDRYGRRRMMLISMGLMTFAMLITAVLPTRAQIGPSAAWLLLLMRCIMGFSVGGEYNGVVAYLLEGARKDRRGLVTSLASAASEFGGLVAVGVSALTVNMLSSSDLDTWGWRVPFFFGAVLAAVVWAARSRMHESPDFKRQEKAQAVPKNPLGHMLATQRRAIGTGFAISALGSITYYVGVTYVPTFLTETGAMTEGDALWFCTAAAVVAIAVSPIFGILSDRVGRRPVMLLLGVGAAVLPVTMFALMAHGSRTEAVIGAFVLAALGGGVSAVGAVTTAEQFSGAGRLSGLALGASSATALFGGLTPYLSQTLLDYTGWPLAPGAMIAVVAAAVLPVLFYISETRPKRTS